MATNKNTTKKKASKKPAKKKGARKPKPAFDAAAEHNRLAAIEACELRLNKIELDLKIKKSEAKRLRDEREAVQFEMRRIIRREDTDDQPLIDFAEKDGWRKTSLAFALSSVKFGEKLEAAGCGGTLGSLVSFLEERQLRELQGMSDKVVEEIETRLEEFWKRNPQWTQKESTK